MEREGHRLIYLARIAACVRAGVTLSLATRKWVTPEQRMLTEEKQKLVSDVRIRLQALKEPIGHLSPKSLLEGIGDEEESDLVGILPVKEIEDYSWSLQQLADELIGAWMKDIQELLGLLKTYLPSQDWEVRRDAILQPQNAGLLKAMLTCPHEDRMKHGIVFGEQWSNCLKNLSADGGGQVMLPMERKEFESYLHNTRETVNFIYVLKVLLKSIPETANMCDRKKAVKSFKTELFGKKGDKQIVKIGRDLEERLQLLETGKLPPEAMPAADASEAAALGAAA